jgi:hypothetical protein
MTGLRPDGYELGGAIMSPMREAGVRPDARLHLKSVVGHSLGAIGSL